MSGTPGGREVAGKEREFAPSLADYLGQMVEMRASDLFLTCGRPPAYRRDGQVVRTRLPAPSAADMERYLDEVLTPLAKERFRTSPDIDVAHTLPRRGRFRVNLFMHQGVVGLVARLIPLGGVPFDTLDLPNSILELAEAKSGLVLVVGPTGCGKSTTLAALVHHINERRADHIVTIEDPIEFVHDERRAVIHHRQVGVDTVSFQTALKHVVRQNPDVVLIGEMRDRETVETALNAALTGHLILSTLHTTSVVQSIDRMLSLFDPAARPQAQLDLADTLVGIVGMRLLRRKGGKGRVPAVEVLRRTPTVRRLIAEADLAGIYDIMKRSGDAGMQTMNQSLHGLVRRGLLDEATALAASPNQSELRLNLEGMFTGIDSIDLRTEPDLERRAKERE